MRLLPGVAAALLLSACGGGDDRDDNGAAADNAALVGSTPVAGALTPSTPLPAGEGIPGVSAPPPAETPGPAPVPDLPVQPEAGADAAVTVLRDYFAALSGGRYAEAYRLWNGRGEAAGMTRQAFADSFAKYAEYRATIGTPGRIDAGAGQRYIDIPVRVTGRLRDGTPVVLEGPVTLHRTGDIDGATAEQRSWRISASALKPRPTGDAAR
ncbi:hypothetical protein [Sphingomonas sp. Leaf4]|uniref:hypothetical protein n=1 Tax=Sphingomonas sp. Leaf4 TaxID=2876553 RepID=UPI001E3B284F|nr:hypothetical protein [Sphingomonas sp. Leaf4]